MMNHRAASLFRRLSPLLALALLGAASPAQTAKPTYAVVDMQRAASHTKAFKTGVEQRGAMAKSYNDKLDELKKRIEALKLEIDIMQDSPERLEKELEQETLIGRLKVARKMFGSELERQRALNDDKIYSEISKAVSELAAQRGVLLVLRKHPHRTVKEMLEQKMVGSVNEAINQQIRANQQRVVIYHAPALDLTDDLIKYLKK